MANPFRQLASETAIYGLSTILARIINFFLVPIYTRVLTQSDYGTVTELMSWIAVLQVALVLGLETGCFRFANDPSRNPGKVFDNAFLAVFAASASFLALSFAFAPSIAGAMELQPRIIRWCGCILALDAVTAILFARLRQEHKAFKFALVKTLKIFTELGVNLYLFLAAAKPEWLFGIIDRTPDYSYVIFAILVSCAVCALLLLPEILRLAFRPDGRLLKEMLLYSLPIMVAALPGVVNDLLDRVLFRWFDTSSEQWRATLGVYQAAVKLSVIMNLFIQMFRYAAEPFFFQRASEADSRQMYSKVMTWFVAFCGLVFVAVTAYIDVLSLLLGKNFRSAVGVVPVMLLSYIILGMLFNVNMWYKLSGKTSMAIWVTLAGLAVTAVVNIAFMPIFSYWASAAGHMLSYLTMLAVSLHFGNKYYRIDYQWKRISLIFVLMALCYVLTLATSQIPFLWARILLNTLIVIIYATTGCAALLRQTSGR